MKITIAGGPREGKTSMAFALSEFFVSRGFKNVTIIDEDLKPGNGRTYEFNDACIEKMARLPILVETKMP